METFLPVVVIRCFRLPLVFLFSEVVHAPLNFGYWATGEPVFRV